MIVQPRIPAIYPRIIVSTYLQIALQDQEVRQAKASHSSIQNIMSFYEIANEEERPMEVGPDAP